jgi:hypothetical protein
VIYGQQLSVAFGQVVNLDTHHLTDCFNSYASW